MEVLRSRELEHIEGSRPWESCYQGTRETASQASTTRNAIVTDPKTSQGSAQINYATAERKKKSVILKVKGGLGTGRRSARKDERLKKEGPNVA